MFVPLLVLLDTLATAETCPAAVDVDARMRSILHLPAERQLSESFLVERHEAGLYVALRSADATLIGERRLPLEGSCDELAQAAAVVLAAWLTDVHPDFAGGLPPRTEPEVPAPETRPAPEPVAPPRPAARPPAPVVPPRAAPRSPWRFDAALGGGFDLTSGTLAAAGLASIGYGAEERGLGAALVVIAGPARKEPLQPGQVRWWRWPLAIAARYRVSTASLSWDLSAGPMAAWLHLEGLDFYANDTQDGLVWGGFLSGRISGKSPGFAPFGLVSLQVYPATAKAFVKNGQSDWEISKLSFTLSVGARLSL